MIHQSNGKIYLSNQRGVSQKGNDYQSYHTFNFGSYYNVHKAPIGSLLFFNDDTLNIGVTMKTFMQPGTSLLLLPIVGGLAYKGETSGFVEAGQVCLLKPQLPSVVEITNPYKTELVNIFQIGVHLELDQIHCSLSEFDLESEPDRLIPLLISETESSAYTLGGVGKFGGKKSGSYPVKNPMAGVFAFVIDGVFEVQDRLLQSRDGLALWDEQEIEFEALSREAIILFLEITPVPEALK